MGSESPQGVEEGSPCPGVTCTSIDPPLFQFNVLFISYWLIVQVLSSTISPSRTISQKTLFSICRTSEAIWQGYLRLSWVQLKFPSILSSLAKSHTSTCPLDSTPLELCLYQPLSPQHFGIFSLFFLISVSAFLSLTHTHMHRSICNCIPKSILAIQ